MKKLILLALFFIIINGILFAQTKVEVQESKESMSAGYNNCLKVFIPEAATKDIERDWTKMMKDEEAKVTEKKGEVFADNASMTELSSSTVDVYAIANEEKGGVEFLVFFDLGGAYLNSNDHPDAFSTAKKMVRDFAIVQAKAAVTAQVDIADKELKKLQKDQENLKQENENLKKKIEDCKSTIQQSEQDLKTNDSDQQTKVQEIDTQQKKLDEVKNKLAGID